MERVTIKELEKALVIEKRLAGGRAERVRVTELEKVFLESVEARYRKLSK